MDSLRNEKVGLKEIKREGPGVEYVAHVLGRLYCNKNLHIETK